jgi:hypothetical protein
MVIDPYCKDKEHGVASQTAGGDGVFPVFQILDNGALIGVLIDFMADPPDRDEDGTISLGNVVLEDGTKCVGCNKPFKAQMLLRDPEIGLPRCWDCFAEGTTKTNGGSHER